MKNGKKIALYAVTDINAVISVEGRPLYANPKFNRFGARHFGVDAIIGRKTYDALLFATHGDMTPGWRFVVLSHNPPQRLNAGCVHAGSWEEALTKTTQEEVFVAGGASLYEQAMFFADHIYLTTLRTVVEGRDQQYFPNIPARSWESILVSGSSDWFSETGWHSYQLTRKKTATG